MEATEREACKNSNIDIEQTGTTFAPIDSEREVALGDDQGFSEFVSAEKIFSAHAQGDRK